MAPAKERGRKKLGKHGDDELKKERGDRKDGIMQRRREQQICEDG
jgi:hypothetical protein